MLCMHNTIYKIFPKNICLLCIMIHVFCSHTIRKNNRTGICFYELEVIMIFVLFAFLVIVCVYWLIKSSFFMRETKEDSKMNTKSIYFAGGCFWGMQAYFDNITGVVSTMVGYANGHIEHPTYEMVCKQSTGHAETIQVLYDDSIVSLSTLLELYFEVIDPVSINRQGNDIGNQYRTGVYYSNIEDRLIIKEKLSELQRQYEEPIVVECEELHCFYPAEEYHQEYLHKNPNGYCHIPRDVIQNVKQTHKPRYQKPSQEQLKAVLSEEQYAVTQENKTEKPFKNAYYAHHEKGIYVDITTGEPLFLSSDKYESGCGWPSFTKPISDRVIKEKEDQSHGMNRIEVRSHIGDAHLGHVFNDGPMQTGGLRYCINSASLRFIPYDQMEAEGYGAYCEQISK